MWNRVLSLLAGVVLTAGTASAISHRIDVNHSFDAEAGDTVVIDASFHDVKVVARPGSTVEVRVEIEASGSESVVREALEELAPRFEEHGSRILIRSIRDHHRVWSWGRGRLRIEGRIEVTMPPGLDVTVDVGSGEVTLQGDFGEAELAADTGSGAVRLDGAAGDFSADTGSGAVEAVVTRPLRRFVADTGSGSVSLDGGADDARADTGSGSVELAGLTGSMDADTGSGSVTASWASITPRSAIRAGTGSGGVTLELPAGTVLGGLVSTGSGGIRSDFAGHSDDDELRLDGGPGEVTVRINTSSGRAVLRARQVPTQLEAS